MASELNASRMISPNCCGRARVSEIRASPIVTEQRLPQSPRYVKKRVSRANRSTAGSIS